MGGALNIITKKKVNRSKIKVGHGSYDSTDGTAETYQKFKKHYISLIVSASKTQGDYEFNNPKHGGHYVKSSPAESHCPTIKASK